MSYDFANDPTTRGGVYWGYLRAVFRQSKSVHGDESKAMYDMVKMAREDGCPDDMLTYLVETLRQNGDLSA